PRERDVPDRRSASGRPDAASEEVRVAEREAPRLRIRVELTGKRLAHEVERHRGRNEAVGGIRGALAWARKREQRLRPRFHAREAGAQERPYRPDEIRDQ